MRAFKRLRSASGGNEGCSILKMSGNRYLEKSIRSPLNGGVAQLGEHLLCKQGVRSSILLISTMGLRRFIIKDPKFIVMKRTTTN